MNSTLRELRETLDKWGINDDPELGLVIELEALIQRKQLEVEIKTHERYDIVPMKYFRQHIIARKNIILAELKRLEEK